MVIYADVIFFVNFIFSYMLLYVLGKVIYKEKAKIIRLVLSSTIGGISACIIFCLDLNVYAVHLSRLVSVAIMLLVAYNKGYRGILKKIVWYITVSGIILSAEFMVMTMINGKIDITVRNGIAYFDINPKIFILSLTISSVIMFVILKMFKLRQNKKYYVLNITHNNRTISVCGLFDSGNLLKEPITSKPVTILEWEAVKELLNITCDFSDVLNHSDKLKLWAIPFTSLGNPTGIMMAFLVDKIDIFEENVTSSKSFIGISEEKLSPNGEYHALINANLL